MNLSTEELKILAEFFEKLYQWDQELEEKKSSQMDGSRTIKIVPKLERAI